MTELLENAFAKASKLPPEKQNALANWILSEMESEDRFVALKDQAAIVTGASSGIGRGVAEELDSAGMKLVLTGRRVERLESLAAKLADCLVVPGDIAEPHMPQRLIDAASERFGRCDVVFNNAGLMRVGRIEDVDVELMAGMVRVNLEAATRMAYTALKHFKAVGSGHLVNVSSILGTKVRDTAGVYAATM